ncbi:DUF397 domain-containing protein [Streptomyces lanatus]|uniref:DUF397 domain-containing protein n=1 Tax=Streptomyces lanatus TaxID=66900 RepID=A0ABV1XJG7_9ACTN|nr:DUF397 domain-containing protein [Streptomyces lanatus]GHG90786.1 hypothetical protein GCM10018780_10760 [Streptomyces lanatus]
MESTGILTGIQWRKSTYSGDQGGDCIEIAGMTTAVAIRDSKNPAGPILTIEPATFTAFLAWTTAAE